MSVQPGAVDWPVERLQDSRGQKGSHHEPEAARQSDSHNATDDERIEQDEPWDHAPAVVDVEPPHGDFCHQESRQAGRNLQNTEPHDRLERAEAGEPEVRQQVRFPEAINALAVGTKEGGDREQP